MSNDLPQSQRDLYIAMRDLFIRHDRLSVDQVERLKKRVDMNSVKLEGIRAVKKEGWQAEEDKLAAMMEKDKVTITAQLNRRVFIRAWYVAQLICTLPIFFVSMVMGLLSFVIFD